jgi:hypothetical protein
MLSYVFWHWPRPGEDAGLYERSLAAFHQALAARQPAGLLGSLAFRLEADPRVPAGRAGYQDWYLLADSAALDIVNDAAVTGSCRVPHDGIAGRVEGALAGLLKLRHGTLDAARARAATWFGKPEGMTYDRFFAWAESLPGAGAASLWGRQMGLGPPPEFCFVGPEPVTLPLDAPATRVGVEVVWASPVTRPRPGSAGGP